MPADGTMIVTYCECPRAAAEYVNRKIRELGFTNTAVLWEGIRGWVSLGYPVARGETTIVEANHVQ
jgi:rhodanese-related sulfurtransferase